MTDEATDNRMLHPMAEATREVLERDGLTVVADAGYSNGAQASACEADAITACVPANRAINNQGDETLFDRTAFVYEAGSDGFRCPAGRRLVRKQLHRDTTSVIYASNDCSGCALKPQCTTAARRFVTRHLHEEALNRMNGRHARHDAQTPLRRRASVRNHQADDGGRTVPHQKPQRNENRNGPLDPRLQHAARHQHRGRPRLKAKEAPVKPEPPEFPHCLRKPPFLRFV